MKRRPFPTARPSDQASTYFSPVFHVKGGCASGIAAHFVLERIMVSFD
jgi:hypothetical protein